MKKTITSFLFLILFSFGISAQDFPHPYCDIEDTTIEEITSVEFGTTLITNDDASSILIDKTSTIMDANPGETYTLTVMGNTYGAFETKIVAFIDWNQNDILDDDGEIYEVGIIVDSDGYDGESVSMPITVPEDAELGNTRVRITKTYRDDDSVAIINPCAIEMNIMEMGAFPGFGQGLDFTMNIETLSTNNFDINALSVYPVPSNGILNVSYESELTSVRIYNLLGQEVFSQNAFDSHLQLDLSALITGSYIMKLFSEDAQHSLMITKN